MIRIVPGTPGHDVWLVCDRCGGKWLGQPFDECEWCDESDRISIERAKHRILFPEWLDWGERYWQLSELDQRVWEGTRGFHGDYQGKWMGELKRAVEFEQITRYDAIGAVNRYRRWKANNGNREMPS